MDAARERTPFDPHAEHFSCEDAHRKYILAELAKSKLEADDPNTKWLTHEEIMANINDRREVRNRV
jgi:hypothetical protein